MGPAHLWVLHIARIIERVTHLHTSAAPFLQLLLVNQTCLHFHAQLRTSANRHRSRQITCTEYFMAHCRHLQRTSLKPMVRLKCSPRSAQIFPPTQLKANLLLGMFILYCRHLQTNTAMANGLLKMFIPHWTHLNMQIETTGLVGMLSSPCTI